MIWLTTLRCWFYLFTPMKTTCLTLSCSLVPFKGLTFDADLLAFKFTSNRTIIEKVYFSWWTPDNEQLLYPNNSTWPRTWSSQGHRFENQGKLRANVVQDGATSKFLSMWPAWRHKDHLELQFLTGDTRTSFSFGTLLETHGLLWAFTSASTHCDQLSCGAIKPAMSFKYHSLTPWTDTLY